MALGGFDAGHFRNFENSGSFSVQRRARAGQDNVFILPQRLWSSQTSLSKLARLRQLWNPTTLHFKTDVRQ